MDQPRNEFATFGAINPFKGQSAVWRKSCHADNGCVEVARLGANKAGFRDNTRADSPVIALSLTAFQSFVTRAKEGAFDT